MLSKYSARIIAISLASSKNAARANVLLNSKKDLFRPFVVSPRRFNSTSNPPPNTNTTEIQKKPTTVPVPVNPANVAAPVKSDETAKKLTIWEKVKHEAHHYWEGTKLLGLEIKISTKLLVKMSSGYELTRREYRQLQRTISDVLRLFPFAMFVIIPFAELLLPIAIKIFPNLLPSTYESKTDKDKKLLSLRNTRKSVVDVLTNAKQMVKLPKHLSNEEVLDFKDFMKKLNSSKSDEISRAQLFRVARMFKDDLILDNSSRGMLIAFSKYINIRPYGTDQMLRYRIRHKLLKIKADDRLIEDEGVASLSLSELKQACASRGISMYESTPGQMKTYLSEWLNMRLHEKIPSTLMILVNAYSYGDAERYGSTHEALKAVLSSLPAEFYHEQELHVDLDNATVEQRLKVLKEQEQMIASENVQEKDTNVLVTDKLSLDDEKKSSDDQKK